MMAPEDTGFTEPNDVFASQDAVSSDGGAPDTDTSEPSVDVANSFMALLS